MAQITAGQGATEAGQPAQAVAGGSGGRKGAAGATTGQRGRGRDPVRGGRGRGGRGSGVGAAGAGAALRPGEIDVALLSRQWQGWQRESRRLQATLSRLGSTATSLYNETPADIKRRQAQEMYAAVLRVAISMAIFLGNFHCKCRDNGELPLKNDDFAFKNGHFFCNSRYRLV